MGPGARRLSAIGGGRPPNGTPIGPIVDSKAKPTPRHPCQRERPCNGPELGDLQALSRSRKARSGDRRNGSTRGRPNDEERKMVEHVVKLAESLVDL